MDDPLVAPSQVIETASSQPNSSVGVEEVIQDKRKSNSQPGEANDGEAGSLQSIIAQLTAVAEQGVRDLERKNRQKIAIDKHENAVALERLEVARRKIEAANANLQARLAAQDADFERMSEKERAMETNLRLEESKRVRAEQKAAEAERKQVEGQEVYDRMAKQDFEERQRLNRRLADRWSKEKTIFTNEATATQKQLNQQLDAANKEIRKLGTENGDLKRDISTWKAAAGNHQMSQRALQKDLGLTTSRSRMTIMRKQAYIGRLRANFHRLREHRYIESGVDEPAIPAPVDQDQPWAMNAFLPNVGVDNSDRNAHERTEAEEEEVDMRTGLVVQFQ